MNSIDCHCLRCDLVVGSVVSVKMVNSGITSVNCCDLYDFRKKFALLNGYENKKKLHYARHFSPYRLSTT